MKNQSRRILVLLLTALLLFALAGCSSTDYKDALALLEQGEYKSARNGFAALGDYKDAQTYVQECDYLQAKDYMKDGEYDDAAELFEELDDYKDAEEQLTACAYAKAESILEGGDLAAARDAFLELGDYEDAAEQAGVCVLTMAENLNGEGTPEEALALLKEYGEVVDGEAAAALKYQIAGSYYEAGNTDAAAVIYEELGDYEDAAELLFICQNAVVPEAFIERMQKSLADLEVNLVVSPNADTAGVWDIMLEDGSFIGNVSFGHMTGDGVMEDEGILNRAVMLCIAIGDLTEADADLIITAYLYGGAAFMKAADDSLDESAAFDSLLEYLAAASDNSQEGTAEFSLNGLDYDVTALEDTGMIILALGMEKPELITD